MGMGGWSRFLDLPNRYQELFDAAKDELDRDGAEHEAHDSLHDGDSGLAQLRGDLHAQSEGDPSDDARDEDHDDDACFHRDRFGGFIGDQDA